MSLAEILFSAQLIAAFLGYAALSVLEALASARLHAYHENDAGCWLWQHVYAPLLRAATLLLFVLMAYPTLYGLAEAPTVTALLSAEEGRFGHILGIVFVLSLALPLMPVLGALPALMLPIQGVVAAALLFHWLATSLGAENVRLWPGGGITLGVVALSATAYWLAGHGARLTEHMGHRLFDIADLGEVAREALVLLFQAPAIVLYAMVLGSQLSAH